MGLTSGKNIGQQATSTKLAPFGYHECLNTPGLWYHDTHPILFMLVVEDFGVKYINNDNVKHLIASLKTSYKLTEHWTGDLYYRIALHWDNVNRIVDISMPGYIKKKIQECGHLVPGRMQKCPYLPEPKKFGSNAQASLPPDDTPKLDANGIKRTQQIVGGILYYPQAVDMMVLMAFSSIAIKQMKATKKTIGRFMQLLDYLTTNEMTKIRFHATKMILNIHSDASYSLETGAPSRACGHFFMGWMPNDNKPIQLNRAFHTNSTIMRFMVTSAAEAKLGTLFHNCQTGFFVWQTLKNLGHHQPKIPFHCNNATAVGIANNMVKCP